MHISKTVLLEESELWLDGGRVWNGTDEGDFPAKMKALYKALDLTYPKFYKMDNLSKFGFLAVEALLSNCPQKETWNLSKTGVFLVNASSSLDTDQKYFETVSTDETQFPSPALFVYTLPNILIGEICIRHKFTGEQGFFVSGHFDSEYLYPYLEQLFQNSLLERAIVGWVEIGQPKPTAKIALVNHPSKGEEPNFGLVEMKDFFENKEY